MIEREAILHEVATAQKAGARRAQACRVLGLSVRTLQRWESQSGDDRRKGNSFKVNHGLTLKERKKVIEMACSSEFRDLSPNQIVPILAEKGQYIASESTFFRILKKDGLLTHRSKARAPERKRPEEIIATGPNQVWTWDISYLLTTVRREYIYLYLILDIWDRSIVGWAIHDKEDGKLAGELLNSACERQGVCRGFLTVHQDNGGPMLSHEFLMVLNTWGKPSFSRAGVSDDNAYSESLFRTVKYRPDYPGQFDSIQHAKTWMTNYIEWYHNTHRHSAIGFVTPMQRRTGKDIEILEARRKTYEQARTGHPERWSRNVRRWNRPTEVALNPRKGKNNRQTVAA